MNKSMKFEVVSAKNTNGELSYVKHAGVSFCKDNDDYFKLNLNVWPTVNYFVAKNHSNKNYTIFSKKVMVEGGVKFQNPVGYARTIENLKTHMFLKFEVPNVSLYMSLCPSN